MPTTSANKLAATSLTLGLIGWAFYLLQWCFDLSLGLILTVVSGGASAVCATVLDFLPFVLWLIGIVTGHVALAQIKRTGEGSRRRAVFGLVINYLGVFFVVVVIVIIVLLLAAGIGVGWLGKVLPSFR